jgi:acyl-CoA synthetase (AMP-forming)/AMP-acid ligase II/acyl carrier protein
MDSADTHFGGAVPQSLGDLLRYRANTRGAQPAITFVDDAGIETTMRYGELLAAAQRVANLLTKAGPAGSRALLLYPPGIDFLIGFFGCSLSGWVPTPTCFPRPGRSIPRLDSIAQTCQPSVLLTTERAIEQSNASCWSAAAATLPVLATDTLQACTTAGTPVESLRVHPTNRLADLALLQFTSGSTSRPKGVMVSQANMMSNLESIRQGFGIPFCDDFDSAPLTGVFWLPAFHDMGLIGGLLSPLYAGGHSVILTPRSFLSRPLNWLKTISDHRAIVTGAPNFAYQLCVERIDGSQAEGVDLECLQVAFCGAEPIQARTLEHFASRFAHTGFQRSALAPCYGLAESTLYVSSGSFNTDAVLTVDRSVLKSGRVKPVDGRQTHSDSTARLVCCGTPGIDCEIQIVDPANRRPLGEMAVGEIWIRGASVAQGYWQQTSAGAQDNGAASDNGAAQDNGAAPDNGAAGDSGAAEQEGRFDCRLAGQDPASQPFLRSGDLGFLYEGKLFVTGRSKDLIILRGRNHYPQDIEVTVQDAGRDAFCQIAAVACNAPSGEGLAVVAELSRTVDDRHGPDLIREVRRAVIEEHEIDPRSVILVRQASLPITTSGKLQRSQVRQLLESEGLQVRSRWDRADMRAEGAPLPVPSLPASPETSDQGKIAGSIETWILAWLTVRCGVNSRDADPERTLDQLGLDSLSAVELSSEVEDWLGLLLTPIIAYEHPTPRRLANHLAQQWISDQQHRVASDAT